MRTVRAATPRTPSRTGRRESLRFVIFSPLRSALDDGTSINRKIPENGRILFRFYRSSVRPNFFIVGAPKCGTTAWHAYLGSHPDIFFSEVKEPNYFATDMPRTRWVSNLRAYESLFKGGSKAKFIGEASAMYLYSTRAAENIRNYNPDSHILMFLRCQGDFLPSYHHQLLYRFAETIENFETAWRLSGNRPPDTIPKTCLEPKMLDYAAVADFRTQVGRFLSVFPREKVMVIAFDDWTSNPRATYLKILDFLGLKDDGRTEFPKINEAQSYRVKWLGRLIARPPRALQIAVNLLKKITGRDALGLGRKASKLISAPGYTTSISRELRDEIRSRYAEDNLLLAKRLEQTHEAR